MKTEAPPGPHWALEWGLSPPTALPLPPRCTQSPGATPAPPQVQTLLGRGQVDRTVARVFGHPTAGGGPGLAACPVLPADLTSLPGAAICGQGGLSRPPRLIEPGFLLRPPARLPAEARPPPGPRLCLSGCLTQASPSQMSVAIGRGSPCPHLGDPFQNSRSLSS